MTQQHDPRPDSPPAPRAGRVSSIGPARLPGNGAASPTLPADHLERIIRRATQLQNRGDDYGDGSLTPDEVIRIAEEVGLEAQYVRRAMAEIHAETLFPDEPPESRIADAVLGACRVQVRRVMNGDAADIQRRIETLLADEEHLSPLRQRPLRSFWEPATGLSRRMRRTLSDRSFTLAKSRSVDVGVGQLEPGWALVTVTADIGNRRKAMLESPLIWVPIVTLFGTRIISRSLGIAATSFGGLLIGVALFAAGAGISIWHIRRTLAQRRRRLELVLDGLLDRAA